MALAISGCGTMPAADDMGTDGGSADLAGGGDGGSVDLSFNLTGTRLATGDVSLIAVTSDGWAIYYDYDTEFVNAVNSTGGMPQKIAGNTINCIAGVSGTLAFVWHDCDTMGTGALAVWSSAGGVKEVAANSPGASLDVAAASPDNSLIAYFANYNGGIADLVIDKPDHSAPKTAATTVIVSSLSCPPKLTFAGNRLIASRCGMGPTPPAVTSYDATGTGVDLLNPAADYYVVTNQGDKVLVSDDKNNGTIFPAAGGMALATGITDLLDAQFLPDGSALLYVTNAGALNRISSTGGMPTLLQSGSNGLVAISPDGKSVLYHGKTSLDIPYPHDLFLAPTAAPAMAVTINAELTSASGGAFGESFTDDSTQALYYSAVDTNTIGIPKSIPTAGGMASTLGAQGVSSYAASASRIVLLHNWVPIMNEAGRADLEVLDLASSSRKLLANQVDLDINLTPDKKSVLFTFTADMPRAGLYVAPLQ